MFTVTLTKAPPSFVLCVALLTCNSAHAQYLQSQEDVAPVADLAVVSMAVSSNYGLVIVNVQNIGSVSSQNETNFLLEAIDADGSHALLGKGKLPALAPRTKHTISTPYRQTPGTTRTIRFTINASSDATPRNNQISRTHRAQQRQADLAAEIIYDPRLQIVSGYVRNVGRTAFFGKRTARRVENRRSRLPEVMVEMTQLGPGQRKLVFRDSTRGSRGTLQLLISPGDGNSANDSASHTW